MEEDFKVIDNYLMVKMPEEVDHHKSVYIKLLKSWNKGWRGK